VTYSRATPFRSTFKNQTLPITRNGLFNPRDLSGLKPKRKDNDLCL
jgi:hypothetical protein